MTKAQKSLFKTLRKDKHRQGFVHMLTAQQKQLGGFDQWTSAYLKKLKKKGVSAEFLEKSSQAQNRTGARQNSG